RAAQELPRDRPVDQPDRGLERARPVRPAPVGARREPAVQLVAQRPEPAELARERVSLRERHQLQVPVRLPQILDVADEARVAVVEQLAERERRLDAGLRIAVPARRIAEIGVAQREDVEPAGRDAIGRGENGVGVDARRRPDPGVRKRGNLGGGNRAGESEALGVRPGEPQHAVSHLRGRHAPQAVDAPQDLPERSSADAFHARSGQPREPCEDAGRRMRAARRSVYRLARPSAWRSTECPLATRARQASPMRARPSRSAASVAIARAIECGSRRSTNSPWTPSLTSSGIAPTRVTIAGSPAAIASRTGSGAQYACAAATTASASRRSSSFASPSTAPQKPTAPWSPRLAAKRWSDVSSGPSPATSSDATTSWTRASRSPCRIS